VKNCASFPTGIGRVGEHFHMKNVSYLIINDSVSSKVHEIDFLADLSEKQK
jgi:hypothetical protein